MDWGSVGPCIEEDGGGLLEDPSMKRAGGSGGRGGRGGAPGGRGWGGRGGGGGAIVLHRSFTF